MAMPMLYFLRGKAYSQLKEYKLALVDLEKSLNLYRGKDDKKYQIYVLFELIFIYTFNGKTKEGYQRNKKATE